MKKFDQKLEAILNLLSESAKERIASGGSNFGMRTYGRMAIILSRLQAFFRTDDPIESEPIILDLALETIFSLMDIIPDNVSHLVATPKHNDDETLDPSAISDDEASIYEETGPEES